MIIGLWHPGSGVGDQLFCYLTARITAKRLGVTLSMYGDFKGKSFLPSVKNLVPNPFPYHVELPSGKIVVEAVLPLYGGKQWYDPEFNFIADNTIVDGCKSQDIRYYQDHLSEIRQWLQCEHIEIPETTCVINFRGGEYAAIPDLFLPHEYWEYAMGAIKGLHPEIRNFEVHTDDPVKAAEFFPYFKIIHDISVNWRSVRYAKYAIIANSAFGIIPRILAHDYSDSCVTIAPRYWARRNTKQWSTPQNYYKGFIYV